MKTHIYINRTTQQEFRKAHIQVTHTLRFADLADVLAFLACTYWDIDADDITKSAAEKAIRATLTESGSEAAHGWHEQMDEDEATEIREWAEEHARRWWGADFGNA